MKNFKLTHKGYLKFVGIFAVLTGLSIAGLMTFSDRITVRPESYKFHFPHLPLYKVTPKPHTDEFQASIDEFDFDPLYFYCKENDCSVELSQCDPQADYGDCEVATNHNPKRRSI